jgi:tellurite resistance protein TehA-like permease
MATGILSIAAGLAGQPALSIVLLALATIAFIALVVVDVPVAALHRDSIRSPRVALLLFTWAAACGVLGDSRGPLPEGAQLVVGALALAGWVVALGAVALMLDRRVEGWRSWKVQGSWLLGVVATQSLAILASTAAQQSDAGVFLVAGLGLWLAGLATYTVLIMLIVRRHLGGGIGLDGFSPEYWIAMGALAISTLAALDLSRTAASLGLLDGIRGGVATVAEATWGCAAAWIPYLCVVELAHARSHGLRLRYDPRRWSTVFPLGMFSVASFELQIQAGLPGLGTIAGAGFWVGLAVALLILGSAAGTLAGRPKRCC